MEKQYNHQDAQHAAQAKWQAEKTYKAENNPGPLYSIDTPPPTVSGNLHIGHIFSYTQTDIIARYKRMDGNSVFYPFGFDDNGLPTERYVEKKLGISAHKLSRTEFINLCLKETHDVEQQFKELWQRMGLSVDWDYCYSTISESTRKISQESFIRLFKKGYIYRKQEPALYCTSCRTSVAQADLDDAEKPSTFNDIAFHDEQGNELIIATTRPELLGACVAVFYHPSDARYQHLQNKKAMVPLYQFSVPILADEKVNPEKGTGLVMCCTFGDKTDIEWYKKHQLPYKQAIGFDGKLTEQTGLLSGLTVLQGREQILKELESVGLLKSQKPIMHSVNVHERCKKEIEILMLAQWFLKILDYKMKFIELADKINWYPAHMKSRYINWVENLGWDWGLSRQRFYGIPFPVWHCKDCNEILLPELNQLPIDPQETAYPSACTKCGGKNIIPDTDVMDTWNTSSLTPYIDYAQYNPATPSAFEDTKVREFIPMSMRPQAHDIIRTWAFYTIVKTWMHHENIPWHDIVISGHVLADSKEKLSKSKENSSQSPQGLLERYPADAIRYWTASGGLGQDIAFSEPQLKIGLRLITKLWNAFRFIQEHITQKPASPFAKKQDKYFLALSNEWLLHNATKTYAQYSSYMEQHEFGLALQAVEKFFWHSFCDNYLELIKDQLFNPGNYTEVELHATRWTLYQVGLRILQMYAPYMPYITESLYGEIYQVHEDSASIHQTKFAAFQTLYDFPENAQLMDSIIDVIAQARKLKSEKQLSLKTPFASLTIISTNEHLLHQIMPHTQLIRGILHAQEIHFKAEKDGITSLRQEGENWVAHIALAAPST